MTDNWSDEWISAVEKLEKSSSNETTYFNDEGIRYLIGTDKNEWLHMHGEIPENRC